MNKLVLGAVIGLLCIAAGGVLLSISTYYNSISFNYNDNCYTLYPPSNGTFGTYPPAYYTCESNLTRAQARAQLYSSLVGIPGWVLAFGGGVAFVLSLALLLISFYKDRDVPPQRRR